MRNLTEVSLKNKVLVWYFIIVTAIGGIFAYNKLGRMEDPQFANFRRASTARTTTTASTMSTARSTL